MKLSELRVLIQETIVENDMPLESINLALVYNVALYAKLKPRLYDQNGAFLLRLGKAEPGLTRLASKRNITKITGKVDGPALALVCDAIDQTRQG